MKFHIKMKKFATLIFIQLLIVNLATAQMNTSDFLRSTGKIYSVVAVIVVIFIGIIMFLFRLDHKLTKLENHIKNE